MKNIYHLITPGLDSVCTYFYILEKVKFDNLKLIHIPVSPKYSKIEQAQLMRLGINFDRGIDMLACDVPVREDLDGFIPSRNLLLATIVDSSRILERSGDEIISFSFTKDDRVYDSADDYCQRMNSVLYCAKVESFVRDISKEDLIRWFLNDCTKFGREQRIKIILETYSCYSGGISECLCCNACFRKSVVLHELGILSRPCPDQEFLNRRLSIFSDITVSNERKKSIEKYINYLGSLKDAG